MQLIVPEGLDRLHTHWAERPGWRPGRTKYALHLTMEHADEVLRVARTVQPVAARFPALDPVPEQWLHLTMTGIGFVDEVTPTQLQQVLARVDEAWAALQAPQLQVSGLLLAPESVRLVFEQSRWLMDFVQAQRDAVDAVLGAHPWQPFRPHVSLAYANGACEAEPVRAALEQLAESLPDPSPTPATFTPLELARENPLWHWTVLPRHD